MSINKEKFSHLESAVRAVIKPDNARLAAVVRIEAQTEKLVVFAIEAGSLAEWDEYREELDRKCRVSKVSRKSFGYEEVEVERKGAITLVIKPRQTLANIFSVLRQAFVLSVPLHVAGEPRAFNAIKADKVKAAAKVKAAKADDRSKDIDAIAASFKTCLTRLKNVKDPADVAAIRARIEAEVMPMFPTAKESAK